MPDISSKLGLVLPTQVDAFSTADIRNNWEKIDAAPGAFICTSGSRPTWTAAQEGRHIYETNTGLEWIWDGAKFVRASAFGLLKRSDGSWAIGERATDYSTNSKAYVVVVSVTNVVIPAGTRPIRAEVAYNSAQNTVGAFSIGIFRSATNNSGPLMSNWLSGPASDANAGGGAFWTLERNGLAAGTYSFSLQIHSNSVGGTSTLRGSSIQPITIAISEM